MGRIESGETAKLAQIREECTHCAGAWSGPGWLLVALLTKTTVNFNRVRGEFIGLRRASPAGWPALFPSF
jgi:hypothetical protein